MKETELPRQAGDNRIAPVANVYPPVAVREWLSGVLIGIVLCWPFLLPSLLPIRWWMLLPLAVVAAFLRWQPRWRLSTASYPLLGLAGVIALFVLVAATSTPLADYGREKLFQFIVMAGFAFLVTFRQLPLTEMFARGMRHSLLVSLALCLLLIIVKRHLFLDFGETGAANLREEISTTGMPLALALAACGLIASRISPLWLFGSSIALLGIGVLEVLVRGRFDAIVLTGVAVLLILGPPYRHLFSRLALFGLLVLVLLFTYVDIAPRLGESYTYLEQLRRGGMAGRLPLYQEAWRGFLAHPLGLGIGAFQRDNPMSQYPHNIVLEVAYEMGILGLACVMALYLWVARRFWQLWLSPPHRMLGVVLLIVFLQPLKAGNIATFAFQWVLLYMLVVATPLSESWPLTDGKVRQ
jgi:O-antigen ligase